MTRLPLPPVPPGAATAAPLRARLCTALRTGALAALAAGLAACGGESSSRPNADADTGARVLTGFVGSPSLAAATVTLLQDDGGSATSALSGNGASYSLTVSKEISLPIHMQVQGGTDLLTGQPNDTVLSALSFDSEASSLSITHLSSLAAEMAACSGPATAAALETSWQRIRQRTGLTTTPNPPSPSTAELAALMRADLSLAESISRTRAALAATDPISAEQLLSALACDLADDAALNLSTGSLSPRLAGIFRAAETGVLLELIADTPYLDGQAASAQIDEVLRRISGDPAAAMANLPPSAAMIEQAERNLALLRTEFSNSDLFELLLSLFAGNPRSTLSRSLNARRLTTLWALPEQVALADTTTTDALGSSMAMQRAADRPIISLSADPQVVDVNGSSRVSWAASDADVCRADGAWSGNRAVQGSEGTGPLSDSREYGLHCAGLGGLVGTAVQVAVVDSATRPTISLSADDASLTAGQSTVVRWTSRNATACTASGAWSGSRPVAGSRWTGSLSSTADYSLTCTGPGGSDTATLRITVEAPPQLPPQPAPTLSLSASPGSVQSGGSTRLSWSSSNATSCQAGGAWSGSRATSGSTSVGPLTANSSFQLTCSGPGGSINRTVSVSVSTGPAPDVNLSASDTLVNAGGRTTLNWNASNASSCAASGGWSGSRSTSGSATVGPLNAQTTFSLSCTGSGGTALDMVAISVNGTMSLNWVAPTENVDGSSLTDLAGYRVYYGQNSRNYTEMVEVTDRNATSTSVTLPSGDYYVAMTALDAEGNESAYSNEVLKTVP